MISITDLKIAMIGLGYVSSVWPKHGEKKLIFSRLDDIFLNLLKI